MLDSRVYNKDNEEDIITYTQDVHFQYFLIITYTRQHRYTEQDPRTHHRHRLAGIGPCQQGLHQGPTRNSLYKYDYEIFRKVI